MSDMTIMTQYTNGPAAHVENAETINSWIWNEERLMLYSH